MHVFGLRIYLHFKAGFNHDVASPSIYPYPENRAVIERKVLYNNRIYVFSGLLVYFRRRFAGVVTGSAVMLRSSQLLVVFNVQVIQLAQRSLIAYIAGFCIHCWLSRFSRCWQKM